MPFQDQAGVITNYGDATFPQGGENTACSSRRRRRVTRFNATKARILRKVANQLWQQFNGGDITWPSANWLYAVDDSIALADFVPRSFIKQLWDPNGLRQADKVVVRGRQPYAMLRLPVSFITAIVPFSAGAVGNQNLTAADLNELKVPSTSRLAGARARSPTATSPSSSSEVSGRPALFQARVRSADGTTQLSAVLDGSTFEGTTSSAASIASWLSWLYNN
jgi:hypothetical protein